jgi:dTDP-4-dehydrorhamnose 3,5-epimerase
MVPTCCNFCAKGFFDKKVQAPPSTMNTVKKIPTSMPGVFILEPRVFGDERGYFVESYNERTMAEIGITERFVQDNHSCSCRNVLRGLHYQIKQPQGKLVHVTDGEILNLAVDVRRSSPTFGHWEAVRLYGENKRMLWIPVGALRTDSAWSQRRQTCCTRLRIFIRRNMNARWRGTIQNWRFAGARG